MMNEEWKGGSIMGKLNELEIAVAEVVDYLRMTGQFSPALQEVVQRKITAEAAKRARIKVSSGELQKAADAFRVANGLNKASDTDRWLKSNGLTLETFEGFLETNLLINKFKDALGKKTPKGKYLTSPAIKESVTEIIYVDWLAKAMK
jgi:hypothetical protein